VSQSVQEAGNQESWVSDSVVGVKVGKEECPQIVEPMTEGRGAETGLPVPEPSAFTAIDEICGIADHDR
jgi:hypothetical protein